MKTSQLSDASGNANNIISDTENSDTRKSDIDRTQGTDINIASQQTAPTKTDGSKNYGYIIIGLLVIALLGLYGPRLLSPTDSADGATADSGIRYVSDLDFWQRTKREVQVTSSFALDLGGDLNLVPMTIGKWVGQDMPDTNREVEILLEPEQYVRRLYQHEDGNYIWLSLIGGRSSQPFHAPDICYDADGWQYNLGSHAFDLQNDGQIFGLWLDAEKQVDAESDLLEHFVSYFYIFPDKDRELSDGIVLFKLTSSRFGTLDKNLDVHQDFVSNVFSGM